MKNVRQKKSWTKPVVAKLGKLSNVAGSSNLGGDGVSANGFGTS